MYLNSLEKTKSPRDQLNITNQDFESSYEVASFSSTIERQNYILYLLEYVLCTGNTTVYQYAFGLLFETPTDRNQSLTSQIINIRHKIQKAHSIKIAPLDGRVIKLQQNSKIDKRTLKK